MGHIDIQLSDIRQKIVKVKENRNNHFRHPREILAILSLREMQLEDQVYFMKLKYD